MASVTRGTRWGMPVTEPLLRLRTPADLIATLPYLLGYRLEDSLVVAAVDHGRLGLMQRFDLPGNGRGGPPRWAVDVARRMLRREDPESVLIVAFESSPGAAAPLRTAVSRMCDRNGWPVVAEVVARGNLWWDIGEGDDPFRPGRPIPSARQVPAVAECVAAGLAPLPGRAALAELFESTQASTATGKLIAAERAQRAADPAPPPDRYRGDAAAWRSWLTAEAWPAGEPTQALGNCLARCIVSLDDTDLRDALIAWLAPGLLPPAMAPPQAWAGLVEVLGPVPPVAARRRRRCRATEDEPAGGIRLDLPVDLPLDIPLDERGGGDVRPGEDVGGVRPDDPLDDVAAAQELRERARNRVVDAARATPAEDQVPLLTVFASLAWWQGDGALAGEAAERALRLRPSYPLALLLREMIRQGIRFGTTAGTAG